MPPLEQLRRLTEIYPDYALAYSGMAAASGLLAQFGLVSGRDVYPEVKANAERGYALDPESGDTCTVLGALRAWFEHRWDEADTMYDRALKLQPSHAPAHMFRAMALLCQGDIKAAESGLRRSTELDPLSASDCARMAYLHYVKGDYPSAAEHLRQSFELDRDYPEARLYEGLLHFQQQRYDAVIQCLSPSDFTAGYRPACRSPCPERQPYREPANVSRDFINSQAGNTSLPWQKVSLQSE